MTMQREIDPSRGERGFRWSPWWAVGPVLMALALGFLVLVTLRDFRGHAPAEVERAPWVSGAPDAGPVPAARTDWPAVEQDLQTLRKQPDLRAASAARRLWARGRTDAIVAALERPETTPALRVQLLALAAADPSEKIKAAARRLLKEKALDKEASALCRTILEHKK